MIDRAPIVRAFSPTRNLRSLLLPRAVAPDARHLAPLDGLRALAILWTMSFHSAWFTFIDLPGPRYAALLLDPRMLFSWRGHFGVDAFFVLSGFLIAGILFDERERTGRLRLGVFYVRRLMRLWPALLVAITLVALAVDLPLGALWPDALYVGNFVPVLQAHMPVTWSLAIEEHFYLVCPWLVDAIAPLGARGRLRALALLVVLACVVAAVVTIVGEFHAFDTEIAINRPLARWARGYDGLYSKPWMRVGPLLAGVMAAVVQRSERARGLLARSGAMGTLGLVIAVVVGALAGGWQHFVAVPRWLEVTYVATHRSVFGACVAYVLLLSISDHRVGRAIGRVLGARVFHPIAQFAYSAYLLNPLVTVRLQRWIAPSLPDDPVTLYACLLPLDIAATLASAAVVYLLIERPFMELRPRVSDAPHAEEIPRTRGRLAIQIAAMIALGIALPLALTAIIPAIAPSR